MTAGQRAMATAMLYPDADTKTAPGRRSKDATLFAAKTVSSPALSQARTVLRDQALAERVLAGTSSSPRSSSAPASG
jgi:hypothetical protein